MSHLQALISRTIVHIVLQFYVLQFFVLVELSPGFVMQKGIPIAVVRLRQKTVRHKNCKTICTTVLEINA